MKNLSLILNIVLLVAVGVLYYLHFAGSAETTFSESSGVPSDVKIAYITSDSVLKHYEYLDVNRKVLEGKSQKLEQELRNRAQGLQNEISNYQRSVNNLTLSQAKAMEEDLGKKQQNLQLYQQSLEQQLAGEEAKLNKELYDRITSFLKKYGSEKGLHVVFKYDVTSDVLYGGEALDITSDVIKGLNEDYKQENTTAKPDSAAAKK
jgi:outer membrane protein